MLSYSINTNAWLSTAGNEFIYDFAKDLYFKKSGSSSTEFGFDVGGSIYSRANAQLGLDYTVGFGLVGNAKLVGGGTTVAFNVDPNAVIANDTLGSDTASIDTSQFEIVSGALASKGIDLSKSSIDLGLGGELKAGFFGSLWYAAGVDIPGFKTKNPLYNPAEWIEVKTKNPLYDPNEWIIVDLLFGQLKTKNPLYNPAEWIVAKTKNPLYDPNEWIITHLKEEITDTESFNNTLIDFKETISLISLKGADAKPWELDLTYAKLGARLPDTLDLATSTLGSDGSLSVSGVTAPFVTAGVDVDAALLALFGLPPNLLSGSLGFDWGALKAQVNYNLLDAALNGNISLGQDLTFDPNETIGVEMKSSFGEVLTGKLGDKFEFETPEGEGTFTVTAKYNLTGDLKASSFLKLGASFDYKLLDGQATVKVGTSVAGHEINREWSKDFSLLNDSLSLGGGARIDLATNTKEVAQTLEETYTLSYENFVTAASGALMTLTTHQVSATGGAGANTIVGNELANILYGAAGNDKLKGNLGLDTLFGEDGKDSFIFDTNPVTTKNMDKVMDFRSIDDTILLDNAIFTKVGRDGKLNADAFVTATHALDAEDRVIYDQKTGQLSYDLDGIGKAKAVQFALIANKAGLTAADISIL
jgi:Ca2+-binding RTX toxin-like protein